MGIELIPVLDRVIVERDAAPTQSAGGIYIPDVAREKPQWGTVVASGPGKLGPCGARIPTGVKAGDRVIFGKYDGDDFLIDGRKIVILRAEDLMAVEVQAAAEPAAG